MIKLFRDNNKFRLVNTEKVFVTNKNEIIFRSSNVKFSFCNDIENIGEFDDDDKMVNLLIYSGDDNDYIPVIDKEITEDIFDFIKYELENITKKYGNIFEYEIIEDNNIIGSGEFDTNTVIKDVLRVEFDKVFDKWGCRIIYQNFDVLERYEFKDEDINVSSLHSIEYDKDKDIFYILGKDEELDDGIIIVDDKEKKEIEDKVKLINKKYGTTERWRAEYNNIYYFIIGRSYCIEFDYGIRYNYDIRDYIDDNRYEVGNYFRTRKLAENKLREIKELLLK